jgi:general secretion pathway protein F
MRQPSRNAAAPDARRRRRSLNERQRIGFFRRFGSALAAGIPAITALDSLARSHRSPAVRRIVQRLTLALDAGMTLPQAFAQVDGLCSPLDLAVIEASDAHGGQPEAFAQLAEAAESRLRFQRGLQLSMLYPLLVTLVGAAAITFLVTFVIPRFIDLFGTLGHQLPTATRTLLAFARGFAAYGPWAAGICIVAAIAARLARRTTMGSVLGDWLLLHLPGVGAIVRRAATARFARAYGLLTAGGIDIGRAVRLAGAATGNVIAEQVMVNAAQLVDRGTPLSLALRQDRLFLPILREEIESGEQSGQTDVTMLRTAVQLDASVRDAMTVLTILPQVLVLVVLGGLVLWIALAIMVPWFQLPGIIADG